VTVLEFKGRYYKYLPRDETGYHFEDFTVDVKEAALVAVDLYNTLGYSPEDPPAPEVDVVVSGERKTKAFHKDIVLNCIAPALEAARSIGLPVIYVTNSAPRINIDNSEFARRRMRFSGWRTEDLFAEECVDPREYTFGHSRHIKISKVVEPQPGDFYVRKHVNSGFFETRLDSLLRNLNTKVLFFVGFALDSCLGGTMIDALYRNYKVVLLRDGAAANDLPHEEEDMAFTRRMVLWVECKLGVTLTSQEFVQAVESQDG
jgi:ureidoacrylate peracid hydrolase